jgi:type II secretory pathway pseudopilin PulG
MPDHCSRQQHGFTYLGLLFAVAIIGITLATIGVIWSTQARREREIELLFTGNQIRQAIGRYYEHSGVLPRDLSELVEDRRLPAARRFLRRLYMDPITGAADWTLIKTADGGIMGVASSSLQKPIRMAGFSPVDAAFQNADCYCGWRFVYVPNATGRPRVLTEFKSS